MYRMRLSKDTWLHPACHDVQGAAMNVLQTPDVLLIGWYSAGCCRSDPLYQEDSSRARLTTFLELWYPIFISLGHLPPPSPKGVLHRLPVAFFFFCIEFLKIKINLVEGHGNTISTHSPLLAHCTLSCAEQVIVTFVRLHWIVWAQFPHTPARSLTSLHLL